MTKNQLMSTDARIVECVLFIENEALDLERLCSMTNLDAKSVKKALGELDEAYQERGHGLRLKENSDGSWEFAPCSDLYDLLRSTYGRKVDDLRRRYSDFLWNGEFLDVLGATVSGNNIRHTVFVNRKNGKKAVVVYNVDTGHPNEAKVSIDGSSAPLVMVSPGHLSPKPFSGTVTLGPQSVVVIMEK